MARPTIEDAISFAALKHKGQKDKTGAPFIFHPLSVMRRLQTEEERMAGVLHDVVEDCDVTFEDLRVQGFSEAVIEAVEHVTRRPEAEESYEEFIQRTKNGPTMGIKVKLADLADNLDPARRPDDSEKTRLRVEKYERAVGVLREELARREGK